MPDEFRARLGSDKQPHPFGNLSSVWIYAERCGEFGRVLADWAKLKDVFGDFAKLNWRLDSTHGDLFANRYLASLLAFARLAEKAGDAALAAEAKTKGDGISFAVAPHRHKLALFQDLTPEVAALVKAKAPDALAEVWETFSLLYRTWPLVGEERQVHSGENFVDPPDLALGGFKALAWLRNGSAEELAKNVDLPLCRADLYYITKLAVGLEKE